MYIDALTAHGCLPEVSLSLPAKGEIPDRERIAGMKWEDMWIGKP